MIVGICGYGNSGASAVIDYLKGFDKVQIYDFMSLYSEFQIIHEVDGINDLKYHLTKSCDRIACNTAIKRFKRLLEYGKWGNGMRAIIGDKYQLWCKSFLDDIIVASWKGKNSSFDADDVKNVSKNGAVRYIERIVNFMINKINNKWNYPPKQIRYFSILSETEFDIIARKHLMELFSYLNIDNTKINIIDQLFSTTKASLGMEFVDGAKTIIVVRDPRDIYVTSLLHLEDSRFMPNTDVVEFIKYYRTLNRFIEKSDNTLIVQYEDIIYKYDETTQRIGDFLGIHGRPEREFVLFNPLISVKYTNRVNLYEKVKDDIAIIEKELPEFLYDFNSSLNPKENLDLINRTSHISYVGLNIK